MESVNEDHVYDVVVVGGGTGGYSTALRAAALGLSVALVERDLVGGTCLHRGCIPSKALLHAAGIMEGIEDGHRRWGIHTAVERVDAAVLAVTRDQIVDRNFKGLVDHLHKEHVTVLAAQARVTSPRTVALQPTGNGSGELPRELTARRGLVIATGSIPRELPGLSSDGVHVLTSDQATRSDRIPKSVIVVGAGAVGLEFATFYRSFGADVTIVEVLDRVLPTEDPDVSREMARALRNKGITVHVSARIEDISRTDEDVRLTLATAGGKAPQTLTAEAMLLAIGRIPVSDSLGLDEIGVTRDRGYLVPADWARLETSIPGVHAVGDLLPPPSLALAHASFAEGLLVAETLAGQVVAPIRYSGIPRATYSLPEAASVGLTEAEARELDTEIVVNRLPLTSVAKGLIYGQGGILKVVAERGGPVLGIHLVGPHVTDLIAEAMLITNWEALPIEVAELIHPHPSLSEVIGEAHLTLANRRLHQLPA